MANHLTIPQAVVRITSKIDPFWTDRVHSMLVHSSISRKGAFHPESRNLRVNPEWPSKGSISFNRGDGKRVRLYMKNRTFKVDVKD